MVYVATNRHDSSGRHAAHPSLRVVTLSACRPCEYRSATLANARISSTALRCRVYHALPGCNLGSDLTFECPLGESNSHTLRYWNLNPARLPIPAKRACWGVRRVRTSLTTCRLWFSVSATEIPRNWFESILTDFDPRCPPCTVPFLLH